MSNNTVNPMTHRLDLPVGTMVVISEYASAKWAGRIMEVVERPKGSRGVNYVVRCKQTNLELRIPYDLLTIYTGDQEYGVEGGPALPAEPLAAGVVARVSGLRGITDGTLVVSLGPARDHSMTKAALLNGGNGRYWPGLPTSALTPVTATVAD